jgi:hypothetical protein
MPARVEIRLGNIFDEPCDLLVIPASTEGMVTSAYQQRIQKAQFPLPGDIPWGTILVFALENSRYRAVAYAAAVSEQRSSAEIIEKIGQQLGREAAARRFETISAPLLGASAGDLPETVAAKALTRGFQETAPERTGLVISVGRQSSFLVLARDFPRQDPLVALQRRVERFISRGRARRGDKGRATADGHLQDQQLKGHTAPADIDDVRPYHGPESEIPAEPHMRPPAPALTASVRMPAGPRSDRTRVFVSYSHADAEWLERLQKHLKPLQRDGMEVWDDTRLKAGEQWREEIRQALSATKIAILLISADFLASDFIVTDELPPLLKAAEEDGATILPVIVSPCRFTRMESLSRFQAVNDPAKPLVQLRRANREKVLDDVARAVEDALKR